MSWRPSADTTVPVLAKGKTDTGRCWIYVRDDRPFAGAGPPAAMFYYSRDRKGEHPRASGPVCRHPAGRPGPIREAACWSHGRRPFFAMADIEENARCKAAGKKESHSLRSRSRLSEGSMRCSRSKGPSTVV